MIKLLVFLVLLSSCAKVVIESSKEELNCLSGVKYNDSQDIRIRKTMEYASCLLRDRKYSKVIYVLGRVSNNKIKALDLEKKNVILVLSYFELSRFDRARYYIEQLVKASSDKGIFLRELMKLYFFKVRSINKDILKKGAQGNHLSLAWYYLLNRDLADVAGMIDNFNDDLDAYIAKIYYFSLQKNRKEVDRIIRLLRQEKIGKMNNSFLTSLEKEGTGE